MIKKLLVLLVLFLGTYPLMAQTKTVSGTVTDATDGSPLPGVNVLVQGTTNGTQTDFDGNYTIDVAEGGVLVFSYIGTATQSATVGSSNTINVAMQEDASQLDEVVVTALGVERNKKSLAYATQSVGVDELSKARETNVANSLSGKIAGVKIVKSSTGPGGSSRVILRGNRSISGSNQPLYVVDGVPIDNSSVGPNGSVNGGFDQGDGISNINPDDIESINVLKGSTAAALYGSRANNGVIIITTKKGRAGAVSVNVNTSFTLDTPDILIDLQNEYGQGNGGIYGPSSESSWGPRFDGSQVANWSIDPADAGSTSTYSAQPNNYKDFFRSGSTLASSVSLNGGTEKTQAYFSYTYTDSKGIVPSNNLKRHNVNLRITSKLTDKLSLDSKVNYITQEVLNRPNTGEGWANVNRGLLSIPRNIRTADALNYSFVNADGNTRQNYWNPNTNGGQNPYWVVNKITNDSDRDRVIGFIKLDYQITDDLKIHARTGMDRYFDGIEQRWANDTNNLPDGNLVLIKRKVTEINSDVLLSYSKQITDDWKLDVNAGASSLKQRSETITSNNGTLGGIENFFSPSNAANISVVRRVLPRDLNSVYGFAQIGFKDYLFLEGSVRNDWSSSLPTEANSFFYPSVGFSAVLSDALELPEVISFAKLRGSWSEVGNDTDPFRLDRTFAFNGNGGLAGQINRADQLPAENLKAENTTSIEFGADLRFFDNRLGFDFTYYKTNSVNQLLSAAIIRSSGFSSQFLNAGEIENNGVELNLNADPVRSDDFNWRIGVNFAKNDSEVLSLIEGTDVFQLRGQDFMTNVRVEVGRPYGDIYARGLERDAQGRVIVGANGIPLVTGGQSVRVGNFNPDWTGGITNRFSYKDFSMSFLIDISQGGEVASFTEANLAGFGSSTATLAGREGFVYDGVTESGAANTVQITSEQFWSTLGGRNTPVGELFTKDASNIRFRELVLGYSLPSRIIETLPFSNISLSVVGRNLFYIQNKAGTIDPEQSTGVGNAQGVESYALPTTRSYGFNLNFSF